MTEAMRCMRCGGPMEVGFMRDLAHRHKAQAAWVGGTPQPALLWGVVTHGREVPVVTYRCEGCGYLESYAPKVDDE